MGADRRGRALAPHQGGPAHERGAARACGGVRGPMKPVSQLPREGVRGLLFDIDETLTTEGRLTAEAYAAMERLKRAGRIVVPVTGRAAGWCDHIARMWPVDAVIGENGAFYFWFGEGKLQRRFFDAPAARAGKQRRLDTSAQAILKRSEEHTSELQSQFHLVCRLLLEKKKKIKKSCEMI